MPSWLITLILPYALQLITPVLVEYVKKGKFWILQHLPEGSTVAVAGVLGEVLNQAQAYLTSHALPYGLSGFIAVLLNSLGNDAGLEPPTPGVK